MKISPAPFRRCRKVKLMDHATYGGVVSKIDVNLPQYSAVKSRAGKV